MVNPTPAEGVPQVSATKAAKYLWSFAVWSDVVSSAIIHASTLLVAVMVASPVTATDASLLPGCDPKLIVAIPVAIHYTPIALASATSVAVTSDNPNAAARD